MGTLTGDDIAAHCKEHGSQTLEQLAAVDPQLPLEVVAGAVGAALDAGLVSMRDGKVSFVQFTPATAAAQAVWGSTVVKW